MVSEGKVGQSSGGAVPGPGAGDGSGPGAVRLRKYPYPYEAAATVASDTDNASFRRFSAIHALFCGAGVIRPGSPEWETLGLTEAGRWYDREAGGVPGLGLDLADTFFLIADDVSLGMYRYDAAAGTFREDTSDGHNACKAIKGWIRAGEIDAFHGFLHYTREQVLPLLEGFYRWCDGEGVPKPRTWINHSVLVSPTGLCPDSLRPNRLFGLARQVARYAIGPMLGRTRYPVVWRQLWYQGDNPGSPFYINDVLRANGLRYVWLEADHDELANEIVLPEARIGGRPSILEPVTMDDGSRYYRFRRCYGKVGAPPGVTVALKDSPKAFDASALFSEENLERLCRAQGACILFTHWTVERNFPLQDGTIGNFLRLRGYRDRGRIWVAPLTKLLEWTRLRTFLKYAARSEAGRLVIDIEGLDDPLFGFEVPAPAALHGLAFDLPSPEGEVEVRLAGRPLPPGSVVRQGPLCRLVTSSGAPPCLDWDPLIG